MFGGWNPTQKNGDFATARRPLQLRLQEPRASAAPLADDRDTGDASVSIRAPLEK